jgi:hypothetical protein
VPTKNAACTGSSFRLPALVQVEVIDNTVIRPGSSYS